MPTVHAAVHTLPAGLTVFERGWLSSNNILLGAGRGDEGATLIDSGHAHHAEQTLQLLHHALGGRPLARIVNSHLHSDHCGGNAALQQACAAAVHVPAASVPAVQAWDDERLSYRATGQFCPRFTAQGSFAPGDTLRAGSLAWQVLAAPGHDPHSVMFFEASHGVLISADALWENGFGVVFPELVGEAGFDDAGQVLDAIERLPVRWVIPGHGPPFSDLGGALARARSRLAAWRAAPQRHARHALKALTKYHLMECRSQPLQDLLAWADAAPLMSALRQRFDDAFATDACERALLELVAAGALRLQDGVVHDC